MDELLQSESLWSHCQVFHLALLIRKIKFENGSFFWKRSTDHLTLVDTLSRPTYIFIYNSALGLSIIGVV